MFNPSSADDAIPFPSELHLLRVQAASLTAARRLHSVKAKPSGQVVSWQTARTPEKVATWRSPEPASSPTDAEFLGSNAAPLTQLWDRDLKALGVFFEREDMHDIETDVIRNLLARWPEPCWEDDPFDFLREFL